MNKIPFIAAGALMSAAAMTASGSENPFLKPYSTPYSIPPFESIEYQHYLPALQEGIAQQRAELDAIINNPQAPTFENTILALDNSGELRTKVELVFGALSESNSSPEMIEIAETFMPMSVAFDDELTMNQALFERVKAVYDNRSALEPDQQRLTDQYYKRFVRNGALLDAQKKEELKKINSALADAYLLFNKNLLAATNAFEVVITDPAELSGLPVSSVNLAADVAKSKGLTDGNWVFTLHAPSRLPVLQYADSRKLRKQIYEGYTTLATAAPYDNNKVVKDILKHRARKAELLGYRNYAAYQTEKVMAKTPEAATELLMQIWNPAKTKVAQEVAEMQAVADENGDGITIEPYDYYYYAEKVRQKKYNLDEAVVREYFPIDSVRKGIFNMAERLYGVKFTELPDAPKYYPEVTVYNVTDAATGEHIAVFMTDYFSRPSKRQGAWMSEFKGSWQNPDGSWDRPIIYNVGNFTPAAGDAPSLLTLDEVETMFHEFGHGLHGMLSQVRYKGQAGTNVDRDFVELPSQIHEHWAMEPELLKVYARHYKTGETIPDALIERLQAAATHNQGFATAELSGAALIDLEFGTLTPEMIDDNFSVSDFVKAYDAKIGMPAQLTYRYRPTYFKHAFGSDEYSCGYYTYLWAEVLDTDGFELFRERGIFDPETAASFKHNILERGGSEDPMELYIRFRGAKPGVEPLLRNRGLEK